MAAGAHRCASLLQIWVTGRWTLESWAMQGGRLAQASIATSIWVGWRRVPSIVHQRRYWIAGRLNRDERSRVVDLTRQDHIVTSFRVGWRRVPSTSHQHLCCCTAASLDVRLVSIAGCRVQGERLVQARPGEKRHKPPFVMAGDNLARWWAKQGHWSLFKITDVGYPSLYAHARCHRDC